MKKNKIYEEIKCTNFRELVSSCSSRFGNSTAFTVKDKNKKLHDISFIDFENNIKELGSSLLDLGLENKKVAIISQDRYEWCCSYLAITTAGCIAVPLDFMLPEVEQLRLIVESKVDAIIFDEKRLKLAKDVMACKDSNVKYFIGMDHKKDENGILSFSKLLADGKKLIDTNSSKYGDVNIDKDKLSVLIYTSGTTNNPKAVMLSQYNICSNVSAMTTLIKYEKDDSILVFLPLHHTLACLASFLFCYYIGFRLCFADSIKDIGKNMVEYKISGLVCVPAVLEVIYRQIIKGVKKSGKYTAFKFLCALSNFLMFFHIDIRRKVFKSVIDNLGGALRAIISGASGLDPKVAKAFNDFGILTIQGYGLTETSPVLAAENENCIRYGSIGFPMPGVTLKIDNPNEQGIGELIAKGPNVMLGYYENEEATNEAIKDGWFHTGDLAKQDKDGYFFITGRKKNVIVLKNGKNIYPEELETLVGKLPYVDECMVFGYPKDDDLVISVKIVYNKDYVKDNFAGFTQEQLKEKIWEDIKEINSGLTNYKHMKKLIITDEPMIKTSTAKIKRHEEMSKILAEEGAIK